MDESRFLVSDSGGAAFDSDRRIIGLMTAQIKVGVGVFELGKTLQNDLDKVRALREQNDK
jgi:hypothetical protein